MMSEDRIIGYKFTPVRRSDFSGMQVASSSSCPITGICISGSGGRKDVISEQAKNLILDDRFSQALLRLRANEVGLANLTDKETP